MLAPDELIDRANKNHILSDNEAKEKAVRISFLYSHLDDEILHNNLSEKMVIITVMSKHYRDCENPKCFCKNYTTPLMFAKLTNYFDHLNLFV